MTGKKGRNVPKPRGRILGRFAALARAGSSIIAAPPTNVVTAPPGTYTITGTDATTIQAYKPAAAAGSYAVTGTNATTTYSGSSSVGGAVLTNGETDALGIDFTYHTNRALQMSVLDTGTPANAGNFDPQTKLTYTSPSVKLTRQSDGVWRYANHNLCLRSQEFDNASWTKSNTTISANSTTAPDGTSTADTITISGSGDIEAVVGQNMGLVPFNAVPYLVSCFLKKNTHRYIGLALDDASSKGCGKIFDLQAGTIGATFVLGTDVDLQSSSMTDMGSGWYLCSIVVLFNVPGSNFDPSIRFCGSSSSTDWNPTESFAGTESIYAWGFQVKRYPVNDAGGYLPGTGYIATTTAAKYDLPYEWDASNASQGILIEEARTNYLTYSQRADNAVWLPGSNFLSVTADNTTAPDGTTTADKLTEDGTAGAEHAIYQSNPNGDLASGTHTMSAFVKAGSRTWARVGYYRGAHYAAFINLSTGALGTVTANTSATVVDAGNGWYRVCVTNTSAVAGDHYPYVHMATADNTDSYNGNGTGTIYVWGMQFERAASFASSPIHTIGATVTRAKDQITLAGSAFPLAATGAGTVIHCAQVPQNVIDNETGHHWNISDGTTSERYANYGNIKTFIADGGATQNNDDFGNLTADTTFKAGMAWNTNDIASVLNGGTVTTDATATLPTVTTLYLGQSEGNAVLYKTYIRQFTYLKRRATNGELQTRTT